MMSSLKVLAGAVLAVFVLVGCEKSSAKDKLAYEACLESAKKDPKLGKATFAKFEDAKVAGSTGEEEIRVNIPYELDGKKQLFQCIAQKQSDGTFKVVF
jgi:hypothetical protein